MCLITKHKVVYCGVYIFSDGHMVEGDGGDVPLAHQAAAKGETQTLTRAIRADPILLEHQHAEGMSLKQDEIINTHYQ